MVMSRAFALPGFVAIALLALVSCSNDGPDFPADNPLTRAGTMWSYALEDTHATSLQVDIEVLSAAGVTTTPEPAAIWKLSYSGGVQQCYVYVSGDTVRIVPRVRIDVYSPMSQPLVFVLPLRTGSEWRTVYWRQGWDDDTRVVGTTPVRLPGGNVDSAYRVERSGTGFNFRLHETAWLVQNVGIARMVHQEAGFGAWQNGTTRWELTAFHLPQQGSSADPFTRVGTLWSYKLTTYPWGGPGSPVVEVQVLSAADAPIAPEPSAVWRIMGYGSVDNRVYASADTVDVIPVSPQTFPVFDGIRYVFPLRVGSKWRGVNGEVTTVTAFEPITVPAGTFRAWKLTKAATGDYQYLDLTAWFVDDVGIVKVVSTQRGVSPTFTESWVLADYFQPAAESVSGITRPGRPEPGI